MQTYRVETIFPNDGILTIKNLPFYANEKVEIIVRGYEREQKHNKRYPLRGKLIRYVNPFESVAENEWDVIK